jgi:hypothetical protein
MYNLDRQRSFENSQVYYHYHILHFQPLYCLRKMLNIRMIVQLPSYNNIQYLGYIQSYSQLHFRYHIPTHYLKFHFHKPKCKSFLSQNFRCKYIHFKTYMMNYTHLDLLFLHHHIVMWHFFFHLRKFPMYMLILIPQYHCIHNWSQLYMWKYIHLH